ncbi:MAG TPA: hypothetical protein EYP53_04700 [Candidatus Latescibacteria bacterium]|nr:hypothetical protein [Candidatus Latescibacterota bacterium]
MDGIPVLKVEGDTLPQVWEKAVILCWKEGVPVRTEYDRPDDPPSRDSTMIMVVSNPMREPRIHRAIPAGLEDLEIYRLEVVNGIHDHWIVPEEGKWQYTYHERLFAYKVAQKSFDQIDHIVEKLTQRPYTRRAQALTWKVWQDPFTDDPPCLQRLWFRILDDKLILNAHMRSNDAYKAAFMNMFAFTDLQRSIAERVGQRTGRKVEVGQYVHIADSFHIYGAYFDQFKGFLKTVEERPFEERVWTTQFAEPFFEEARRKAELTSYTGQKPAREE